MCMVLFSGCGNIKTPETDEREYHIVTDMAGNEDK